MRKRMNGWQYRDKPQGCDGRKIVTLEQGGMVWVGIRAWNGVQWLNNGEPELATIVGWKDLDQPAKGRWIRGQLIGAE